MTHLFSDKTGTITKNEMLLKMFVNNGHVFCAEDDLDMKYDKFMQILCLCHSVQVGLSKSNSFNHVNDQFIHSSGFSLAYEIVTLISGD